MFVQDGTTRPSYRLQMLAAETRTADQAAEEHHSRHLDDIAVQYIMESVH